MINSKKVKRFGAKLLSAVLVAGLLGGILPDLGKEEIAKVEAATPWVAQKYQPSTVRKVVKTIAEMQNIIKPENRNKEIGTKERPFVILEVVNFVDNAHIGYTIGGCEPTAVEDMFGLGTDVFFSNLNSNGKCVSGTKINTDVYFFEDEKEGNSTWYESFGNPPEHSDTNPITVKGYYEVVEAGQGQFVKEKDAVTHLWTLKKDSHGNIVWHTVNEFLNSRDEFSGFVYDGDVTNIGATALTSVGSRLYTTRTTDASNVAYNMKDKYFYVENNEVFLHSVMELTPEKASHYSVVVKSATIKELNTNPEWVDYADFIYFSNIAQKAINHNSVWSKYNRLGVPATSDTDRNAKPNILHNDLNWTVCQKIIDKITAPTDYAALVWDKTIYNSNDALTEESVRYNLRDTNLNITNQSSESFTGSVNNIKKLALCTVNINPNLMKTVFNDIELVDVSLTRDGNNVIYKTPVLKHLYEKDYWGNITEDSKKAAMYWGEYTFMLLREGETKASLDAGSVDRYTSTNCIVKSDTTPFAPASVNNRVYTFNGDTSFIMGFTTNSIDASDAMFPEFSQYMKDHYPGDGRTANNANPADAVRFILGLHNPSQPKFDGTVKVLDIEPSVAIDAKHEPIWKLQPTTIYSMMPNFVGNVVIDHMTSAEFVGKVIDLNSDYDMVYFGSDIGGFNTRTGAYNESIEVLRHKEITDFNEAALDGKIYFHTGDFAFAYGGKGTEANVNIEASDVHGESNDNKVRYNGNDITRLKRAELERFMDGKHPIVFSDKLFNTDTMDAYVTTTDPDCQIANLMKNTTYRDKVAFSDYATYGIETLIKQGRSGVTFDYLPPLYVANSSTLVPGTVGGVAVEEIDDSKISYVGSSLTFRFKVPSAGYRYSIMIDKNRDGRFSEADKELLVDKACNVGENYASYPLSSSLVGFIQWKIKVYSTTRTGVEKIETGCSAIKMKPSSEKKVIKVLQITPNGGGNLNLQTSPLFRKYYTSLKEFKVIIHTVEWSDFEEVFKKLQTTKGKTFTYNIGKGVIEGEDDTNTNPKTSLLNDLNSIKVKIKDDGGNAMDSPYGLTDYNMYVVGFQDAYGGTDLSNQYGAAEFLAYFGSREDRSILYTHDNTSFYNQVNTVSGKNNTGVKFGATASTLLRDQMGMNRYKMVSKYLNNLRNGLQSEMQAFQSTQKYDTVFSYTNEYQGFTIMALHKLGMYTNSAKNEIKQPYKYTITDPSDGNPVCDKNCGSGNALNYAKATGFSDTIYGTDRAAMMNKGQITTYPYYIEPNFQIAGTHPQWYQLNVEDPNVTVWYCLEDNKKYGGYSDENPAIGIGASPMDATNNYYIYSKGNIFYSGVGHSEISGSEEAKLFVNTMIAAYRQDSSAPYAVVSNDDVIQNDDHEFTLQVLRENNGNNLTDLEDLTGAGDAVVEFYIEDGNLSDNLACKISFANKGTDFVIKRKYSEGNSTDILGDNPGEIDADGYFVGLKNGEVWTFVYPKGNLNNGAKDIQFESHNDIRKTSIGKTTLHMTLQPLFFLD